jgi:hypothetical protein
VQQFMDIHRHAVKCLVGPCHSFGGYVFPGVTELPDGKLRVDIQTDGL